MTASVKIPNDDLDLHVDAEIQTYLDPKSLRSFFLFAGAGSGKTRSLVTALDHLLSTMGQRLRRHNQKVAVITYTVAARDEIIRRTQFDPVIAVSTIHHFAWTLIEGFNHDIREWLRIKLNNDIEALQEKEARGREKSDTSKKRKADIAFKQQRLDRLDATNTFIYSADSHNRSQHSLNHAEVLELAGDFIQTKPTLQQILRDGYPYILVDESQDTNHHIVKALFAFEKAHKGKVVIGLFGDMMQRIYGDGNPNLVEDLPPDWARPTKQLNFRCPKRVVDLLNKVREATDQQKQISYSAAPEGHVRMFVFPAEGTDQAKVEQQIKTYMAYLTSDQEWLDQEAVKVLILEHRMAARRMGFIDLFEALYPVTQMRTALLDGSLPLVNFFSKLILPLWDTKDDPFSIARIIRSASPLISTSALQETNNPPGQLAKAQAGVKALFNLLDGNPKVTFGDVANNVVETGLFTVPDILNVALAGFNRAMPDDEKEDKQTDLDTGMTAFLATPFGQVRAYSKYVVNSNFKVTQLDS